MGQRRAETECGTRRGGLAEIDKKGPVPLPWAPPLWKRGTGGSPSQRSSSSCQMSPRCVERQGWRMAAYSQYSCPYARVACSNDMRSWQRDGHGGSEVSLGELGRTFERVLDTGVATEDEVVSKRGHYLDAA